jgi:hypothetical protein
MLVHPPKANIFFKEALWPPANHSCLPFASLGSLDESIRVDNFIDGLETQDFDDGLETQGFIYEEPVESYWEDKNCLDNLGPFANERWQKMVCIHFILPNMTDKGQAATPKTARVPHYQSSLFEVQSKIDTFCAKGGVIRFTIYQPDEDYSNDFLHVINSRVEGIASINWNSLAQLANKKETCAYV